MQKRIEVRNQAEFDLCVKDGNIAIVIGCSVVARENSHVVARENSRVVARENSRVEAWNNSRVEAWDNSHVVAWGNSHVIARENSHVEARGNSHVVAWDNSHVVAWGNAFIRLFSALRIRASAYVTIVKHCNLNVIEGESIRIFDCAPEPKTGREYCHFHGIDKNSKFKIDDIDSEIYKSIIQNKGSLDMDSWHGDECDETNWCGTTHCRAGYAICLAGEEGFKLEKKYGSEEAGKMIYAVSRPDQELPDFHDTTENVLNELKEAYERKNKQTISPSYNTDKKKITLELTQDQIDRIENILKEE